MYLSIDIETTGLSPRDDQVIEIAAVFNDMNKLVIDCPVFHAYVDHGRYTGTPYALAMNKRVFEALAKGLGMKPVAVTDRFTQWLLKYVKDDKVNLLGQNVGSFDLQFLKALPYWPNQLIAHRHLDLASMYATVDGMTSLSERCERAAQDHGIPGELHDALYDARVSLALAREKWGYSA